MTDAMVERATRGVYECDVETHGEASFKQLAKAALQAALGVGGGE